MAVGLAREGADVIAVDLCAAPVPSLGYPPATPADLAETGRLVEATGRRVLTRRADVRDLAAVEAAVADGTHELRPITVVCANAGICAYGLTWEIDPGQWRDVLDVNLTGTWHTLRATVPGMIAAGRGGSIVMVNSAAGLKGMPYLAHYVASKHALVGLVRRLAREVAPHRIRVNSVHPTGLDTPMGLDPTLPGWLADHPGHATAFANALPVDRTSPEEVSRAMVWLASDEATRVTSATLPVDAGCALP